MDAVPVEVVRPYRSRGRWHFALIPLGLFVGIMATDSLGITGPATATIATGLFIIAAPVILCCLFFAALG